MSVGASRAELDGAFLRIRADLRGLAEVLMRQERAGHTLQPTAVVHETYLRLLRSMPARIKDDGHFLALAATTLRRVLVDHGRRRRTLRRGGDRVRTEVDEVVGADRDLEAMSAVAEAITSLGREDPRGAQVAELRLFAGLSMEEIAGEVGISRPTVERDWRFARAWIEGRLHALEPSPCGLGATS